MCTNVFHWYFCGHSLVEKAPCATARSANCGVNNTKKVNHTKKCDRCEHSSIPAAINAVCTASKRLFIANEGKTLVDESDGKHIAQRMESGERESEYRAPLDNKRGRDEVQTRTVPTEEVESSPEKSRKRTKTGCLTCRKRRIKCDEARPTCGSCVKSKRVCEGYNERLLFKTSTSDWPAFPSMMAPSLPGANLGVYNAHIDCRDSICPNPSRDALSPCLDPPPVQSQSMSTSVSSQINSQDSISLEPKMMNMTDEIPFITATSPEDFKSKTNMTKAREQVVGSYTAKAQEFDDSQVEIDAKIQAGYCKSAVTFLSLVLLLER